MEDLLQRSKCSIFNNIFKYVLFQRRQKALLLSKGLTLKAPPIFFSRQKFQILPLFQKLQMRHDITADDSHEISYLIFFEN